MTPEHIYRVVSVDRVVDGDTYHLTVDVGFHLQALVNVRLNGYDCPERAGRTRYERERADEAAREATAFLVGEHLWVQTKKDTDNFGRWLGDIWTENPGHPVEHLGEHLDVRGLASVWPIRWRNQYDR